MKTQPHLPPTAVSVCLADDSNILRRALSGCRTGGASETPYAIRRSGTLSLGRPGIGVWLAVAAGEVWQTAYQFHGQGLRARRAGG